MHLNRKLELQEAVRVPDGSGGFVENWSPLGSLWAAFDAGAGRELAGVKTPLSRVPYVISVRAAPHGAPSRPKAGQRFVEGVRVFPILAVSDGDPNGRYLTCHAEEEIVV
ncbi:head-tail adaptor protein [Aestuariibius sp. HNIBRBA575]|uniref:head-tail adaptor protein n=1 Tax=Aestuariibius sp. HNIBRBA575 TaxID=3233343 RepID=UPI0034A5708D